MFHRLLLLRGIAHLPLRVGDVGHGIRSVEDLGDLLERVAPGFGEEEVSHGEEDDEEAADWEQEFFG